MHTTEHSTPIVIEVLDLSKRFILRKDKSIKERLLNFGRSRKHRDDFWALNGVSLEIAAGTTVGLIGANGSGKSTLLKMIGGIIQPTSGTVRRRGRLAALLELGAGFHPDLTGRENVYLNAAVLGLTRERTNELFDDIVDFSGIRPFIDTQVKFYSSGMYVRLAFAVAVHVDPDVLLVDEVLAVGDETFQRKCLDKIRSFQQQGKTIIIVTHSLDIIGEFCDRSIVLDHGKLVYDGEPIEGIRVLREGLEEAEAGEHDNAFGEGKGSRIVGATLTDLETGEAVEVIEPGRSLVFNVTVSTDEPTEDWVVGMGIDTPRGQVVFGTNTWLLGGRDSQPLTGLTTISFSLPNVHLASGRYSIHASFGTMADQSSMFIAQAATVDVTDGTRNVGVLSIQADFAIAAAQ